jgi:hypothetical protein
MDRVSQPKLQRNSKTDDDRTAQKPSYASERVPGEDSRRRDCRGGETKGFLLPMSASLETQTPPLAANCAVCGIPLSGLAAVF